MLLFVVANSPDEYSIGASTTTLIVADFLHCQTKMGVYRGFRVVVKRISFPLKLVGKEINNFKNSKEIVTATRKYCI